jgi:hypothetical protein
MDGISRDEQEPAVLAGSLPAPGGGSIIARHDRIQPRTSGRRYPSFCSAVPITDSRCMLPSSDAAQFIASGPSGL